MLERIRVSIMIKLAKKQFIEMVLLGVLVLIVSYVMLSNKSFPNLFDVNSRKINGVTLKKESCGYGYEKMPDNLFALLNRQVNRYKETSSLQLSANRGSEFEFSGYTYTSSIEENLTDQTSNKNADSDKCKEFDESQEDIVFVSNNVNDIVKRYISSIYANEKKVISTVGSIKASSEKKETISEINLSLDIEIVDEETISEPKSFRIMNERDVVWARGYSDSMLTVNTLNRLRSVKTVATGSPDTPRNLTDGEITGILSAARQIAIKKATNID